MGETTALPYPLCEMCSHMTGKAVACSGYMAQCARPDCDRSRTPCRWEKPVRTSASAAHGP
jgi:hypothetical protein